MHRLRRVGIHIAQLAIVVVVLGAWQIAADHHVLSPLFFSAPSHIFHRLTGWFSDASIYGNVGVTLEEAAIGFAIAAVAGTAIGLLLARFQTLDDICRPFVDVLNTIPRIALAPLFVLWFGLGLKAKLALVISVVIFNFIINTSTGVATVDPDLIRMARSLGGSKYEVLRKVTVPWVTPWLLAAARVGVAYAFSAAVVAEIISSNRGLGYLIGYSSASFDTAGEFASLLVLAFIGYVVTRGVALLERRLLRWRDVKHGGGMP